MRLYSFLLLASTAVPSRVTDASGAPSYSHTSDNSTAPNPPFTGDSNDGPTNQQLVAQGTANDEERAPRIRPSQEVVQELKALKRTILMKAQNTINRPKLTRGGWEQVFNVDNELSKHVKNPARNKPFHDADAQSYVDIAIIARKKDLVTNAQAFEKRLLERVNSQEDLMIFLAKHGFISHFSFEKARVLDFFFGPSERRRFFQTLWICFNGVRKFARYLSIEKQTLLNGREAKSLQDEMLQFWKVDNKMPEVEALDLINLLEEGWTYETLDTLVEYVALHHDQKLNEVYAETIRLIIRRYSDEEIINALDNGEKKRVESFTLHGKLKRDEAEVASLAIKHTDLADELQKQLLRVWKSDENGLNDVRREAIHRLGKKLDSKLSFDLSLKPPGT